MSSIRVTFMFWAKALDFIICLPVLSSTTVGLLQHYEDVISIFFEILAA